MPKAAKKPDAPKFVKGPSEKPDLKTMGYYKECPICHGWVKGARTHECPKSLGGCGHVFEGDNGSQQRTPKSNSCAVDGVNLIKKVSEFVEAHGGYDKAEALIKEVFALSAKCGGEKGLVQTVAVVKSLFDPSWVPTKKTN